MENEIIISIIKGWQIIYNIQSKIYIIRGKNKKYKTLIDAEIDAKSLPVK